MIGAYRRRALWWVAIVLPGFVLRALIPIGFMPSFGPGLHVGLMLCESYAPVLAAAQHGSMDMAMDMSADMPMDMPMDAPMDMAGAGGPPHDHHEHQDHQDHGVCPYGSAPTLAAMPAWLTPYLGLLSAAEPPEARSQISYFEVAPRAHWPRGPPLPA